VRPSQAIGLLFYMCATLWASPSPSQASASTAATAPPTAASAPDARSYSLAVPTSELQELVMTQLFTDSGRFYPCRSIPSCASWGQNIALSAPSVQVDGTRLVFAVHVSGSYAINQMFAPTVAGNLIVSAVPVVRQGVIHLSLSSVRSGPGDVTFQAFVEAVHTQVEQIINDKGAVDIAPYLAMSARDPSLPPPRIPGVTCVDRSQIHVQSVATDPAASAITTTVLVDPPPPGHKAC
jgi:hypothetical protein